MVVGEILWTAVLPSVVSAVVALVGGGILSQSQQAKDAWLALGLAAGVLVGFSHIAGFVYPPVQAIHGIPYIAAAAAVIFSLSHVFVKKAKTVIAAIVVLGALWFHLNPILIRWPLWQAVAFILAVGGVILLIYSARAFSEKERESKSIYWILIIAATGLSLSHLLDGGAMSGQIGGVLAASCGGLFAASLFGKGLELGPATTGVFSTVFGVLAVFGHSYVEVSVLATGLVLLSGLGLWLYVLPLGQKWSTTARWMVRLGLAALPIAIAIAILAVKASQDSYGGY